MKPFRCELHSHMVTVPCGLHQCGYNSASKNLSFAGNCILRYKETTDASDSGFSFSEIALVEDISESEVKALHKSALRKVSENAILDIINSGEEIQSDIYYVPNLPFCVVCEARVVKNAGGTEIRDVTDLLYYYCSSYCMELKPYYELLLEIRFGVRVSVLFNWALNKFGSLTAAERALNLSRQQMRELAGRYASKKLEHYFSVLNDVKLRRSSELVRRTWHYPSLFGRRAKTLRDNLMHKADAKYGISTVETSDIMQNVENLLVS